MLYNIFHSKRSGRWKKDRFLEAKDKIKSRKDGEKEEHGNSKRQLAKVLAAVQF